MMVILGSPCYGQSDKTSYDLAAEIFLGDYTEKQKQESLEFIEKLVAQGHIPATVLLGCEYINGYRLEKDIPKGLEYLKLGLKDSDDQAMLCMSKYQFTIGDYDEYFQNIRKCAELGNVLCQLEYGSIKFQCESSLFFYLSIDKSQLLSFQDLNSGRTYLDSISNNGVSEASFILGKAYYKGELIEKSLEKAKFYFERCLEDPSFNRFDVVRDYLSRIH